MAEGGGSSERSCEPRTPAPATGRAYIAYSFPDRITDSRLLAGYEELLSPPERARWVRLVREGDRHNFLVSRALVRTLLSRHASVDPRDWRFENGAHGRPEIATPRISPTLRFNLSHTRGLVACVVTQEREVGIDVEDTHRSLIDQRLADRYFSTVEAEALRALPAAERRQRFFRYWTLKESFIKALGVGLELKLARFSFHLEQGEPIQVTFDPVLGESPQDWQFAEFQPTERHRLAVSIRKGNHPDLELDVGELVPPSG